MASVSGTHSPWTIVDRDIVRQYDFENLHGPGIHTLFQVRCTVDRSPLGFRHYHTHFILHPAIANTECWLTCYLGTDDNKTEAGFFPVKISPMDGDANLIWVSDRDDSNNCIKVLEEGSPMRFVLLNQKELVAQIPLANDPSFSTVLQAVA